MDELAHYLIDLEPIGRRTESTPEQSILDAAQRAGVEIVAVCGGSGSCGKCRIRLIDGELSAPTAVERNTFTADDLNAGLRLACQAYPRSHIKIDIPPESLSTPQRLQIEGQEAEIEPDSLVDSINLTLTPPTIHDCDPIQCVSQTLWQKLTYRVLFIANLYYVIYLTDCEIRTGM